MFHVEHYSLTRNVPTLFEKQLPVVVGLKVLRIGMQPNFRTELNSLCFCANLCWL